MEAGGKWRDKIIAQNIEFCLRFRHFLDEWETQFVESVARQDYDPTQKQFNKLQSVAQKLSKKVA